MKHPQKRGRDFMDELDARIQVLTPEQMLDTGEEDARNQENFKMADALHLEAIKRGDKGAIELKRLSQQAERDASHPKRKTRSVSCAAYLKGNPPFNSSCVN